MLRSRCLSVGLVPTAGGAISRLTYERDGESFDILRPGDPAAAGALQMSSFPMLPYCGRLRHGSFLFNDRIIRFPLNALPEIHSSHGDGFTSEWEITEQSPHRAVIKLRTADDAPVRYECLQTLELLDDRLDITLRAENLEMRAIPMELGFHPYFAHRSRARVRAELPWQVFWDSVLMPLGSGPNPRRAQLSAGLAGSDLPQAAEYAQWPGRAQIEWLLDGVQVDLVTDPAISHVVIWAPCGEDFFCFEPLSHSTDSFNRCHSEAGIAPPYQVLPGEAREQCCSLIVRDIERIAR